MTVMTVGDSDGQRRCDGTCHNAKHKKCACICGGKNHGVGLEQAIQNTRDLFLDPATQAELVRAGVLVKLPNQTPAADPVRRLDRRTGHDQLVLAFAGAAAAAARGKP